MCRQARIASNGIDNMRPSLALYIGSTIVFCLSPHLWQAVPLLIRRALVSGYVRFQAAGVYLESAGYVHVVKDDLAYVAALLRRRPRRSWLRLQSRLGDPAVSLRSRAKAAAFRKGAGACIKVQHLPRP